MKHTNTRKLKLNKRGKKKRLTKKIQKGGSDDDSYICIHDSIINCPISRSIMYDPVLAEDGNTYEKAFIKRWFRENRTSPLTNETIGTNLMPNLIVRQIVNNLFDESNTSNTLESKNKLLKEYADQIDIFDLCKNGDTDKIQLLLEKGADVDVNKVNQLDETPLHVACAFGQVNAARMLLDNGAEIDREKEDGATPLWTACHEGHVDAARLVLEKGAERSIGRI